MSGDGGDFAGRFVRALCWVLLLALAVQCCIVVPAVIIIRAWRGG